MREIEDKRGLGVYLVRCSRKKGGKGGNSGQMGGTGGKWGLGGVLSKVLEKKRAHMGVGGCTE